MKFFLFLICFFWLPVSYCQKDTMNHVLAPDPDSLVISENLDKEDAAIEDVLKNRTVPTQDKVQYFSQVTRYGFKNLFTHFSYNSALPYINQINPNATGFIQDYMKGHAKYLIHMKGWGQPYFSLIENVLIQYGLPRELKYIAVIESNLRVSETSNKGAAGPWQHPCRGPLSVVPVPAITRLVTCFRRL
jgi:hypothetical protein